MDTQPLTIPAVLDVARLARSVTLGDAARSAIEASRSVIEQNAAGDAAVYGVNTGFGSLARHRIDPAGVRTVQRNLVRSHAAGVGPPLPTDVVRAMMVTLAGSLARGHSGVRPVLVEHLLDLLNHGVTPVVPSRGSVGASGDLAPLAHV
ncbi:MAG: aromatic amino acid lyase, partial [Phycisphaerales bacterium]|nr:aromatic amino acid lyase [Phycisphaerales bacterium]